MNTPRCATAQSTRVVGQKVRTLDVINSHKPLRRTDRPTLRRKVIMNQVPNDISKANLPPPMTSGIGANRRGQKIGNPLALANGTRVRHRHGSLDMTTLLKMQFRGTTRDVIKLLTSMRILRTAPDGQIIPMKSTRRRTLNLGVIGRRTQIELKPSRNPNVSDSQENRARSDEASLDQNVKLSVQRKLLQCNQPGLLHMD